VALHALGMPQAAVDFLGESAAVEKAGQLIHPGKVAQFVLNVGLCDGNADMGRYSDQQLAGRLAPGRIVQVAGDAYIALGRLAE
jgi:hypothetical protein